MDHAYIRGLVTDLTSLRRGAVLFLGNGGHRRGMPMGIILIVDAYLARSRVLLAGLIPT